MRGRGDSYGALGIYVYCLLNGFNPKSQDGCVRNMSSTPNYVNATFDFHVIFKTWVISKVIKA